MVVVKVRETYDLHTVQNKMTVIGIHTPKPDIIKRNFPGLLLQCRAYRPRSCDVRLACASLLPLDPLGVGTEAGDVSPEDVFNPILYKAMSNKGMSQLEARINIMNRSSFSPDIDGNSAIVDVDTVTDAADEFKVYYGLLSDAHGWKHANPQQGLSMSGLKPLVYELVANIGDTNEIYGGDLPDNITASAPASSPSYAAEYYPKYILGKAKEMPFINCTSYSISESKVGNVASPGFVLSPAIDNCSVDVPWINCIVGCIIIPPSRLHSLYFRTVIEWEIEFSSIRPLGEIANWTGLMRIGDNTHYQNYTYESTKEAITGDPESILGGDSCMVSANVDINKVM